MNSTAVNSTAINTNITAVSNNVLDYFMTLPTQVMDGNAIALIIALVLFFLFIVVINAISHLLLAFLKRTILFMIILLVIIDFVPRYFGLISEQGLNLANLLIGMVAIVASTAGFYIAFRSFSTSFKHHVLDFGDRIRNRDETRQEHEYMDSQAHTSFEFSKEQLNNEKSLMSVLIYLVVAEFGVFSSPTLSAPTEQVGIMFFLIFITGIFFFVKSSYKSFKIGLEYMGVTFAVGLFLAFFLGVLWQKATLGELFSMAFFTSDSLVALITGMGVSLFAGSKG